MPLTRRSEGVKIHLLKAAAQRVGFLIAEFRRLKVPPPAPDQITTPIGAFIIAIRNPVNVDFTSVDYKISPIGGIFPKGTIITLALETNVPGFETITKSIILADDSTAADAVTQLLALGGVTTVQYDQGSGAQPFGITVTQTATDTLRYTMVNAPGDTFDIPKCAGYIHGGGVATTYTGTEF